MKRTGLAAAIAIVALLAMPSSALAEGTVALGSGTAGVSIGLAGLVIALVLLAETLQLRSLTLGGALADHLSYVFLAIVCLAASALVHWVGRFEAGTPPVDIAIASEALVVTAMGLLAAYFYCVRSALRSYAEKPHASKTSGAEGPTRREPEPGA
jgi:hypothetical protein